MKVKRNGMKKDSKATKTTEESNNNKNNYHKFMLRKEHK